MVSFARSLKTHNDAAFSEGKKKQARNMVVKFEDGNLIAAQIPSSSNHNTELWNYEEITNEMLKVGENWANRHLEHSVLASMPDVCGWAIRVVKDRACCNRFGLPKGDIKHDEGNAT